MRSRSVFVPSSRAQVIASVASIQRAKMFPVPAAGQRTRVAAGSGALDERVRGGALTNVSGDRIDLTAFGFTRSESRRGSAPEATS